MLTHEPLHFDVLKFFYFYVIQTTILHFQRLTNRFKIYFGYNVTGNLHYLFKQSISLSYYTEYKRSRPKIGSVSTYEGSSE